MLQKKILILFFFLYSRLTLKYCTLVILNDLYLTLFLYQTSIWNTYYIKFKFSVNFTSTKIINITCPFSSLAEIFSESELCCDTSLGGITVEWGELLPPSPPFTRETGGDKPPSKETAAVLFANGGSKWCGAVVNKLGGVVGERIWPPVVDCGLEAFKRLDEAERMLDEEAIRFGSLHTEVGEATRAISGIRRCDTDDFRPPHWLLFFTWSAWLVRFLTRNAWLLRLLTRSTWFVNAAILNFLTKVLDFLLFHYFIRYTLIWCYEVHNVKFPHTTSFVVAVVVVI